MLIKAGTLVTWISDSKIYTAKPGAQAVVTKDFIPEDEYIDVEWIRNDLSGRQNNGGYHITRFEVNDPAKLV